MDAEILFKAVESGDVKLLQRVLDIENRESAAACGDRAGNVINVDVEGTFGDTPLLRGCAKGQLEAVRVLLDHGELFQTKRLRQHGAAQGQPAGACGSHAATAGSRCLCE